jgi:hypothetical protein
LNFAEFGHTDKFNRIAFSAFFEDLGEESCVTLALEYKKRNPASGELTGFLKNIPTSVKQV